MTEFRVSHRCDFVMNMAERDLKVGR